MGKIATHIDERNARAADAEKVKSQRIAERDAIKTPLIDRQSKMDEGMVKNMLTFPAMMGDAAYNIGGIIKKKLTK